MGKGIGFVGVALIAAIGTFVYTKQIQPLSHGAAPTSTIDVIGVQNDLTAMAHAEKRYWAVHAKYASIDELRTGGDTHIPTRPNYTYSAEVTDSGFRISATYSGPDKRAPKRISVDETMAVRSEHIQAAHDRKPAPTDEPTDLPIGLTR
jgi:hypothetical protein